MTSSSAGQSPDTPEPREVWRGVWLDTEDDTIIVRHRYGSCYDVIDLDATGAHVGDELSSLPPSAVALVAASPVDPDTLARALHDADCGCGDYDEVEDPRYIEAVRAALAAPGVDTTVPGLSTEREQRFEHLATLDSNWDSYDAQPPSAQALVKAREIAVMLAAEPLICPTTDGGVQLAWPPDGERFEIVVAESGAVGITVDDVEFGPASAALAARTPQPAAPNDEPGTPIFGTTPGDQFRLAVWAQLADHVCFIAGCAATDTDVRGPVWIRGDGMAKACTEHWEPIMRVLGEQASWERTDAYRAAGEST